jgi:ABC-2 type transport system ATP-binding protein
MVIKVDNLAKSFDYYQKELGLKNSVKNLFKREKLVKEAVKGISFEIDEGEIVGFLGPNGAGKTTTIKMLAGILYPSSGNATVLGFVPWERKKELKMQFSIVMGQKNQLWWDLPANESLYLNKCIYEIDDDVYADTLEEFTEMLDVKELMKVQVRRLSLGERMKMELIAALIHNPRVIFLDEPTIGLDIISQRKIRDFLKYYNQQRKTTILLTSHYMNDIQDLCKRTVIINEGCIAYEGELAKVNESFSNRKIIKLKFPETTDSLLLQEFGTIRKSDGFNIELEVEKQLLKEYSKIILDRFTVSDFTIEDIPIEDGIALIYQKKAGEKVESFA